MTPTYEFGGGGNTVQPTARDWQNTGGAGRGEESRGEARCMDFLARLSGLLRKSVYSEQLG